MEPDLSYCTRCGARVDAYQASESSAFDDGVGPQFTHDLDRTYWCGQCKEKFVATNSGDTGTACGKCKAIVPLRDAFCGHCGNPMRRNTANPFDVRLFKLYRQPENLNDMAAQLQDLRCVLFSLIQDVAVLKTMLDRKGVWDETLYRELRVEQMVADHSGAGASPWRRHSSYPYTLEEESFLRERLDASEAEIDAYKERIDLASSMT